MWPALLVLVFRRLCSFSYKQIQAAVSKYSVQRTDHSKQTLPERRREHAYVAQMPVPYSTLGQGRAVDPRTPEHSGVEVSTPELFWGWILFWD